MMRRLFHVIALLAPASLAGAESFMLLERNGTITPVQLTVIGPNEVELVDSEEGFQTRPREDCIAFLRPAPSPTTIDRPTVLLRDGQRFPGRLSNDWEHDHLVWDHEWLGTLRIPMERIDRISLAGSSRIQPQPSESDVDRIHLLAVILAAGTVGVMTVLAILDFIYQKHTHTKQMRMTKQELKDEQKQSEGDPIVTTGVRTTANRFLSLRSVDFHYFHLIWR